MKIKIMLLLACVTLANFSCKKKTAGTDEPAAPTQVKLLTRVIGSSMAPPATTYTTNFTYYAYDDQKQLISIKSGNNETVFYYNDKGELYKKSSPLGANGRTDTEISYEGTHIKSATVKVYSGLALQSETLYGYVYSGDNIVEIDVNQNGLRLRSYKFEFAGNKPIKIVCDDATYPYIEDCTYDDKKTIYQGLDKRARMAINLPLGPFIDNNILTDKMTFTTITAGSNRSIVYTYDSDGFPATSVSLNSVAGASGVSENRLTYEYTLF